MSKLVLEMDDSNGFLNTKIMVDGEPVGLIQRLEVKLEGTSTVASMDVVELGDAGKNVLQLLRTVPFLRVNAVTAVDDYDGPPWSETDKVT